MVHCQLAFKRRSLETLLALWASEIHQANVFSVLTPFSIPCKAR